MICTSSGSNVPSGFITSFAKEFFKNLKVEDIGRIWSIRDWEYSMGLFNVKLNEDDIVLDVGCGLSYFIIYIADFVSKVYGIDNDSFENYGDWLNALPQFPNYSKIAENPLIHRGDECNNVASVDQPRGAIDSETSTPSALATKQLGARAGPSGANVAGCRTRFLRSPLDSLRGSRHKKVEVITQNAASLPFPNKYFDKVFTFSALEHFTGEDDIDCCKEVHRVLKDDGVFCGTVDFNPLTEHPYENNPVARVYTYDSFFNRIVKPAGFCLQGEDNHDSPLSETVSYRETAFFFSLRKASAGVSADSIAR